MPDETARPLRDLTPLEEAQAKEAALNGFRAEYELFSPRPQNVELTGRLRWVVNNLATLLRVIVGSVPFWVVLVLLGSAIVSIDKNVAAFEAAAAHRSISGIVAAGGVLMVEFGLLYLAFAGRADTLKRSQDRHAITLVYLVQAVLVFTFGGIRFPRIGRFGGWRVPSQGNLPEMQRPAMTLILFLLALMGNIYTVAFSEAIKLDIAHRASFSQFFDELSRLPADQSTPVYFAMLLGAAAPIAVFLFGEELARVAFETERRYTDDLLAERDRHWREQFLQVWEQVKDERELRELARKYRVKNELSPDAPTPYILVESESQPVPLAESASPKSLPQPSQIDSLS